MSHKLRVVFDTNVFISAILFGGNARICLEQARVGEIALFTSTSILFELAKKLHEKFDWPEEDITEVIQAISVFATIVQPKAAIAVITADLPDNRILEAAVAAKADYIVSGDKRHLLARKTFRTITICTPNDFLKPPRSTP